MNNFSDIISRIKEDSGFSTDKEVAEIFGLTPQEFSIRKKRGTLLPLIVNWGISQKKDLNWLLTGEGSLYIKEAEPSQGQADLDLVWKIIEALEVVLQEEGSNLQPTKKRRLVELLYKRFSKTGEDVDRGIIRDHLRLVAA